LSGNNNANNKTALTKQFQTIDGTAAMMIDNEANDRITLDEPPEGSWWTNSTELCISKSIGQV